MRNVIFSSLTHYKKTNSERSFVFDIRSHPVYTWEGGALLYLIGSRLHLVRSRKRRRVVVVAAAAVAPRENF